MLSFFIILLTIAASFYGWCYIHEMSHILMAKKRVGLKWYRLKLYPHKYNGSWRWAACEYMPEKPPTPVDEALISLAPRIPDLFACWLFVGTPMVHWLFGSGLFTLIWFIFFGAGIVDLINGSLGLSPHSDLQKAAATGAIKTDAKGLRILGFAFALTSIGLTLLSYLAGL